MPKSITEVVKIFTKCDLNAGKEVGMGNHLDFIKKSLDKEDYEKLEGMKQAYEEAGIEFPTPETNN